MSGGRIGELRLQAHLFGRGNLQDPAALLSLQSIGGNGGNGSERRFGKGGDGGNISLRLERGPLASDTAPDFWQVRTEGNNYAAVWARSIGGNAGLYGGTTDEYVAVDTGGHGGEVSVTVGEGFSVRTTGSNAPGLLLESLAGAGSTRGHPFYTEPRVTNGGRGGPVTLENAGRIETSGHHSAAVLAQSIGGRGGDQSRTGDGGQSGAQAGSGGAVSVRQNGAIETQGPYAFGLVAQSVGGTGGQGSGGIFGGGAGGAAGEGGAVDVANSGSIKTHKEGSGAIVAQSIGGGNATDAFQLTALGAPPTGGGGAGGQAFLFGEGGEGGTGGRGGKVTVSNSGKVSTGGDGAHGILAQSVGGGGGDGGIATSFGPLVAIALGGGGGSGGDGGEVRLVGSAAAGAATPEITTLGNAASGILLQSVGGSGGTGGSALAASIGGVASFSYALGGAGGTGGRGGLVAGSNSSNITTHLADSSGISAMSIGGGGGKAGNAGSYALAITPPGIELPSVSMSFAVGGSGGAGGAGGAVELENLAGIHTRGEQSYGLHAMSVGGGGGSAGAASAVSDMLGSYLNISITSAMGGTGGGGGNGGEVKVTNTGTVETDAPFSTGILAQSIGGGGGVGGSGSTAAAVGLNGSNLPGASYLTDAASLFTAGSYTLTQTVGGSGGSGGDGKLVEVTNNNSVETHGANATAIFAQSVGGGGGLAGGYQGGGTGTAAGGVSVGGAGGDGGRGGAVTVNNNADAVITTHAAGSHGIVAQSVGGGGGTGGSFTGEQGSTAFSTSGAFDFIAKFMDQLNKTNSLAKSVKDRADLKIPALEDSSSVQQYLKNYTTAVNLINRLMQEDADYKKIVLDVVFSSALTQLEKLYQDQIKAIKDNAVSVPNVSVKATLGGAGGSGGAGGDITVTNSGRIITEGANSWGMIAQSIGGGGGLAGAGLSSGNNHFNLNLTVGGTGGLGGNGGTVNASNLQSIETGGPGSHGLFAQSVGGGGGTGGGSSASDTISISVDATIGGKSSKSSDGGAISVNNAGRITTAGDQSHGVFAQSVGGGGGTVFVNQITNPVKPTSDADEIAALDEAMRATRDLLAAAKAGGGSATHNDPNLFPTSSLRYTVGGQGGAGGNGGTVELTHSGSISTSGPNSFGIFAQSIGGGGGAGGNGSTAEAQSLQVTLGGKGGTAGNGGPIRLRFAGDEPSIETSKAGSSAVFLQSVGGGGGYVGARSAASQVDISSAATSGNGGKIEVTTASGTRLNIRTTGERAHGIFMQSLGGGGGTVAASDASIAYDGGSSRGQATGSGGTIITNTSGTISAVGVNAFGILAQTGVQTTSGAIDTTRLSGSVELRHTGTIEGGSGEGAAIRIDGGNRANIILGAGSDVSAGSGMAIISRSNWTDLQNNGTIRGNIDFRGIGGDFVNSATGVYRTAANGSLNLLNGGFKNSGLVSIGDVGQITAASINGYYKQFASGAVVVDVSNTGEGAAPVNDQLKVSREVDLQGSIQPHVFGGLLPGSYRIFEAGTEVTQNGAIVASNPESPISWSSGIADHAVTISPHADFLGRAGGDLSQNDVSFLTHLQEAWDDASASHASIFASLANVASAEDYRKAIDTLLAEGLQAPALARTIASRQSMNAALSCPVFADAGVMLRETGCMWARITGSLARRSESASSDGFKMTGLSYRIGAQQEILPNWFAGITAAYSDSWLSANDGNTKSEGMGGDISVSLKRQSGPWLFALSTHLGYKSLDTSRYLDVGPDRSIISSASEVWTLGARFRTSYQFDFSDWYLRPRIDLDAVYTHMPAFTEKSASAFSLRVGTMNEWTPVVSPAIEIGGRLDLNERTSAHPYLSLGASFMGNKHLAADARFSRATDSSPGFVSTVKMPSTLLDVGLGVQLFNSDKYELRAEAKAHIGQNFLEQEGSLRFSVRF